MICWAGFIWIWIVHIIIKICLNGFKWIQFIHIIVKIEALLLGRCRRNAPMLRMRLFGSAAHCWLFWRVFRVLCIPETSVRLHVARLRNLKIWCNSWSGHYEAVFVILTRVELLLFSKVTMLFFLIFSYQERREIVGLWEKLKVLFLVYLFYLYFFSLF